MFRRESVVMDFGAILSKVIEHYPASMRAGQQTQIVRMGYEMSLFVPNVPPRGRVCDLGGGWGTLALGCAAAGLNAVVIDDYRDQGFFDEEAMPPRRALYLEYGVV